jgi:ribonuclease P protein component
MPINLSAHTFTKHEKLCSLKQLDELFEAGKGFYQSPFRFVYLQTDYPQAFPVKVVISVAKRNFKKAVDRNRIKRLIRENYRLLKPELYEHLNHQNKNYLLGIIFTGKQMPEFEEVKIGIDKGLKKLTQMI